MRLARESERVRIKRMNETPEEKAERRRREMEKKRIMRGMAPASGLGNPPTSARGFLHREGKLDDILSMFLGWYFKAFVVLRAPFAFFSHFF